MKEEYLSIETLEKINKLQKELDKTINKKETLKGGLDDVYRKSYYDLRDKINKAIDIINYYAIENEEYDKIYNQEELELLNILKGDSDE